jgi:hypothetical protein
MFLVKPARESGRAVRRIRAAGSRALSVLVPFVMLT